MCHRDLSRFQFATKSLYDLTEHKHHLEMDFLLSSDEHVAKDFWRILSSPPPPQLVTDAANPKPCWTGLSRCGIWSCTDDTELERVSADSALAPVCWKRVKWRANTWESWPLHDGGGAGGEPGQLASGALHVGAFPPLTKCHTPTLPRVQKARLRSWPWRQGQSPAWGWTPLRPSLLQAAPQTEEQLCAASQAMANWLLLPFIKCAVYLIFHSHSQPLEPRGLSLCFWRCVFTPGAGALITASLLLTPTLPLSCFPPLPLTSNWSCRK